MGLGHSPLISTNGLVLCLDAANPKSYSGSGTTWSDLSGNGNTATIVNSPSYVSSGGGYFSFNGSSQYASIPYTSVLAPTSQITYEAFAYLANWNVSNDMRILSKTETGGYQIGINEGIIGSGNVGSILWLGGAYRQVKVARTTLSSGWHHLAFTCDGRYFRMYVDSVNVSTYDHGSVVSISYSNNNHFLVGAEPGGGTTVAGNYFSGRISSVKVYNRGLSASEIQQNFEALRGRFGI